MKRIRCINFLFTLPYTLLVSYPFVLIFHSVGWIGDLFRGAIKTRKPEDGLRMESDGTLTGVWAEWITRSRGTKPPLWRWSTTLGHGIMFQPGLRPARGYRVEGGVAAPADGVGSTSVWDHEFVHVRQTEDLMAMMLFVGLVVLVVVGVATGEWTVGAILGGALWTGGGALQAVWMLTSALRYGFSLEGAYRQSEHERSARAQTQRWCRGASWLQASNKPRY